MPGGRRGAGNPPARPGYGFQAFQDLLYPVPEADWAAKWGLVLAP